MIFGRFVRRLELGNWGREREREKFSKFLGTDASSCVEFRKQFFVYPVFFRQELDGQILDDPNKVIPNICN